MLGATGTRPAAELLCARTGSGSRFRSASTRATRATRNVAAHDDDRCPVRLADAFWSARRRPAAAPPFWWAIGTPLAGVVRDVTVDLVSN